MTTRSGSEWELDPPLTGDLRPLGGAVYEGVIKKRWKCMLTQNEFGFKDMEQSFKKAGNSADKRQLKAVGQKLLPYLPIKDTKSTTISPQKGCAQK